LGRKITSKTDWQAKLSAIATIAANNFHRANSTLRQMAIWLTILRLKMKPPDFSHELNRLMDPYWRKARIAARLLIKREEGKPWSARDRRLAERLTNDLGVTNRLLDQAYSSRNARKKYGPGILGWFN